MTKLITILIAAIMPAAAFSAGAESAPTPQETDAQKQTVIVVVGAGGTEEYAEQFEQWAGLWKKACSKGGAEFVAIGPGDVEDGTNRAMLKEALAKESEESDAALWLILIGHGTFDGRTAKFNLSGPDISAEDLAEWLEPIRRPTAVINSASSSAPFLAKLSAPGRVVITATKSGFEQNYTRLGGYLAQAITDANADLDKDGQTSLLEAFLTASHRTGEFYSASGRLATEHALLDDNGDALGTRSDWFRGIRPIQKAEDGAELDGYRASQFHLLRSETEMKMPPSLRTQRDRLELEVMALRDAKDSYPEEEYFSKLQSLLSQIARIYEQTEDSPEKQQPTPKKD